MFDLIVKWALERNSSFKVVPIKVAEVDATGDNQARRNRFYANFGVAFGSPMNEGVIGGMSDPMVVGDLKCHNGWAARLERLDHLNGLWKIADELQDLLRSARSQRNTVDMLRDQIFHLRRAKLRVSIIGIGVAAVLILGLCVSLSIR